MPRNLKLDLWQEVGGRSTIPQKFDSSQLLPTNDSNFDDFRALLPSNSREKHSTKIHLLKFSLELRKFV
jgi:hypothetical protein